MNLEQIINKTIKNIIIGAGLLVLSATPSFAQQGRVQVIPRIDYQNGSTIFQVNAQTQNGTNMNFTVGEATNSSFGNNQGTYFVDWGFGNPQLRLNGGNRQTTDFNGTTDQNYLTWGAYFANNNCIGLGFAGATQSTIHTLSPAAHANYSIQAVRNANWRGSSNSLVTLIQIDKDLEATDYYNSGQGLHAPAYKIAEAETEEAIANNSSDPAQKIPWLQKAQGNAQEYERQVTAQNMAGRSDPVYCPSRAGDINRIQASIMYWQAIANAGQIVQTPGSYSAPYNNLPIIILQVGGPPGGPPMSPPISR